jgi:Zn-dependent protease
VFARLARDPSYSLLTVGGIPIRVQASLFLLPAWAALLSLTSHTAGWREAGFMVLLVILLYACAALHELGHIWAARRYGAKPVRIRISGLGVFVQIESPGETSPHQAITVALAGPGISALSSAALVAAVWLVTGSFEQTSLLAGLQQYNLAALLQLLAVANAGLTLFNLLPVFPMDGGRALSGLLALFATPRRAAMLVTVFGQVVAIGAVPAVLFLTDNTLLRVAIILTSCFVFAVGYQENRRRCTSGSPSLPEARGLFDPHRTPLSNLRKTAPNARM